MSRNCAISGSCRFIDTNSLRWHGRSIAAWHELAGFERAQSLDEQLDVGGLAAVRNAHVRLSGSEQPAGDRGDAQFAAERVAHRMLVDRSGPGHNTARQARH
jgi:hypothetical protein